jgi:hypothetical protein
MLGEPRWHLQPFALLDRVTNSPDSYGIYIGSEIIFEPRSSDELGKETSRTYRSPDIVRRSASRSQDVRISVVPHKKNVVAFKGKEIGTLGPFCKSKM